MGSYGERYGEVDGAQGNNLFVVVDVGAVRNQKFVSQQEVGSEVVYYPSGASKLERRLFPSSIPGR